MALSLYNAKRKALRTLLIALSGVFVTIESNSAHGTSVSWVDMFMMRLSHAEKASDKGPSTANLTNRSIDMGDRIM